MDFWRWHLCVFHDSRRDTRPNAWAHRYTADHSQVLSPLSLLQSRGGM